MYTLKLFVNLHAWWTVAYCGETLQNGDSMISSESWNVSPPKHQSRTPPTTVSHETDWWTVFCDTSAIIYLPLKQCE